MKIDTATAKGARAYQEDRFIAERVQVGKRAYYIFAVMDGHGGQETAEYCQKYLVSTFETLAGPARTFGENIIRQVVKELAGCTNHMSTGTTLSLVIVPEPYKKAFVAILGDSIVAIKDKDGDIFVAPEHNVRSNAKERQEAIDEGAFFDGNYIYIGDRGLQLSRSLGDTALGDILNREPEIFEIELGEDSVILVASDGLLDPGHHLDTTKRVKTIITDIANGTSAAALVDIATQVAKTGDNVTVVIAKSKPQ